MMAATGLLFLARSRPLANKTSAGEFQLTLLTYAETGGRTRDPWRVVWVGAAAAAWWQQHGDSLQPGQPLDAEVSAVRIHAADGRNAVPEVHAHVQRLALAPWRHTAPAIPSARAAATA